MSKLIKVAITGGIGVGKTFCCRLFKDKDIPIFNSDDEAKLLLHSDPQIKKYLLAINSELYNNQNGLINKSFMADLIFTDQAFRAKVEEILYPKLNLKFDSWCIEQELYGAPYVVKESALIFEKNLQDNYDIIIAVYAPLEIRLSRAINRNPDHNLAELERRIAAQLSSEMINKLSNFVIINDDEHNIHTQIDFIHNSILNMSTTTKEKEQHFIAMEDKHGAHNYHPLPVVLTQGYGTKVKDVNGKEYYDFLSAYSAVNQGHSNKKIVKALVEQAEKLALTSRAFYNDKLGPAEKKITQLFGYNKALFMNSGAEAVETAIKITRKWAYDVKKIPLDYAQIVVCNQNFHGRTSTIISFSSDDIARASFGPYSPGFINIAYNDADALEQVLESNPNIAGFLVEPIQGEAGVMVPDVGYLTRCFEICKKNNVLFIADEIQTGLARTGKMLATHYENIKADILVLGKALSGGMYPISCVLADDAVMKVIIPGSHGSTFGGNPLAANIVVAALDVLIDDNMAENAAQRGEQFRLGIAKLLKKYPLMSEIRGKGLLNAIVINDDENSDTAWNICLSLMDNGLLAKPTHGNKIRLAPPLVITEKEINECIEIIDKTFALYQ